MCAIAIRVVYCERCPTHKTAYCHHFFQFSLLVDTICGVLDSSSPGHLTCSDGFMVRSTGPSQTSWRKRSYTVLCNMYWGRWAYLRIKNILTGRESMKVLLNGEARSAFSCSQREQHIRPLSPKNIVAWEGHFLLVMQIFALSSFVCRFPLLIHVIYVYLVCLHHVAFFRYSQFICLVFH